MDRVNVIPEDECCGPQLQSALFDGLTADEWQCPECECDWTAHQIEGTNVCNWVPHPIIEIL